MGEDSLRTEAAFVIASATWPIDPSMLGPFLIAVALVELTPGPNMGWLAIISASQGRRAGLLAIAGITLGLATYMLAAAAGLAEVILLYPAVYQVLRWAGVAFLLWLAWEAWTGAEAAPGRPAPGLRDGGVFWRGLAANLLNPKVAVFYIALLPGFIDPKRAPPFVQATILGCAHLGVSILVHGSIVMFASGLSASTNCAGAARSPRLRRVFALLIAATALWLAWETRLRSGTI